MKYHKTTITIELYGDTESRISADTLNLLADMGFNTSIGVIHKALHEYAEKVLREGDREVFLGIASEDKKKNIEKLKSLLKPRQYEDDDGTLTEEELKRIATLVYKDNPDAEKEVLRGNSLFTVLCGGEAPEPKTSSEVIYFNDFKYAKAITGKESIEEKGG